MFSHIMIGSNDIARSKKFYDALFVAMGGNPGVEDARGRLAYAHNGGRFMVSKPIDGKPATHANGGTIGFTMSGPEQGRRMAQSRGREWRHDDRGSAWRAPRGRRSDVSRLSPRSRRQETVCTLSQAGLEAFPHRSKHFFASWPGLSRPSTRRGTWIPRSSPGTTVFGCSG